MGMYALVFMCSSGTHSNKKNLLWKPNQFLLSPESDLVVINMPIKHQNIFRVPYSTNVWWGKTLVNSIQKLLVSETL